MQPVPADSMSIIALALIEVFHNLEKERNVQKGESNFYRSCSVTFLWRYFTLPSLVYDPLVWSDDNKQWHGMRHERRNTSIRVACFLASV